MKTFVSVSLGSMWARSSTLEHLDLGDSIWKLTISGKLDFEQIQQLCKSLQATQVEYLELCILQLTQLTIICDSLVVIPSLKHFKFIDKTAKASVGAIFGSMLAKNSTLEHLDLVSCKWGPNGIEALLQPLKGTSTQLPLNRSLKHLSINAAYKHGLRCEDAKAIARMLSSNKTLTHFNLSADYSLEPDDICLILLSLRTNENLQTLGLENCLGVRGTQVFREMLELTQANPWLKSIELSGTQLGEEQKEAVRAQLAANAKQRSETNVETVREKASIYPVTLQPPGEVEVLQEIPAIRPPDPLEDGINNLEVSVTNQNPYQMFLIMKFQF
jgi:Ran GTPase-activating protein (RanGAP) involved in mRNA processing and transport